MKDLSMHIMDIAQNSLKAGATVVGIEMYEDISTDLLTLVIEDNGIGMDKESLEKVTDPYFTSRTTRKVGLGIPFLKQNAELTGGSFTITSEKNVGTVVKATFKHSHIDRIPMGNVPQTIVLLVSANPEVRFIYKYQTVKGEYIFDTDEVNEMLDGVPIHDPEIVIALKEMIVENEKDLI